MIPLRPSPWNSIVVALALTAIAFVVSIWVGAYLEPDRYLLFLAAVWISSFYCGRAGGLTATVASAGLIVFFFLRPGTFATLAPSGNVVAVSITFFAMALLITWVTASWRESRQLLSSTLSSIADAVVATDREGRITFLNAVAETLTGWTRGEARGKPASEVLRLIDETTRQSVENPLARALRDRVMVATDEHTALVSRSGAEVPIEHSASPVRDDAGGLRGAILVFRDISKRRQLEEQATHAQKMEAVGRLAGGVAGDFNNVLTVITGYAELLHAEVPATNPMRRFVDEIAHAGERAAALTRQLRAFSGGAAVQPRVLDLNTVVSGMESLLRRTLGSNIELILLTSPGLGRVRADASQIEEVVVNLASNSRDAMPEGGKLVIETADVDLEEGPASKNLGLKPGSYVMLAVSDTGIGMDQETRSRLFEPLFTTKAPGKGSGLGLATVYSIIKQSEGQVSVYSQPGCGTIFEIYLPRIQDTSGGPGRKSLSKGSETILLVDDEEDVRKLIQAVLQSNGYAVLEANSGLAALAAYEKNAHKIDLVVTDIVMPQMTGIELGQRLAERAPSLKILYISGYRDNPLVASLGETPKDFLYKPFTPDVLLAKVREVLDSEREPRA